jgi:hypothetical protein
MNVFHAAHVKQNALYQLFQLAMTSTRSTQTHVLNAVLVQVSVL